MIDDDMLPPVHSDSDYSDNEADSDDMLTGLGNPNRPPPQVREAHSSDDDSDNDSWAPQNDYICQVSSSLYQRAVWGEEGQ